MSHPDNHPDNHTDNRAEHPDLSPTAPAVPATPLKRIRYPRLTAILAIVLAAANLRTAITALAPLLSAIQEDLGVGGTVIGVLGTIPTAMFALSAFVLPKLKARFTLSEIMLIALTLTALGQLTRVAYPSAWVLLGGSFIALFAIGILNSTMPLVVREYFPNHVPGVSITYMLSSQAVLAVAPMTALPLMRWALARDLPGWQTSLGSWALLSAVAALAWAPLLIRRGPNPDVDAPAPNLSQPVWRTRVGLGLAFMFGSNSLVAYTLMTFMPQIFMEAGAPTQFAAGALSIWTMLGVPITFLGPYIVGRFRNVYPVVAFAGVAFSASMLGFAYCPLGRTVIAANDSAAAAGASWMPWAWVVLSAAGTIVFPMAMVLVNVRARTLEGATLLTSFGQGVGYTVASLGPLITGALFDATGSFTVPLTILSVFGIITIIAGYFATRSEYVEDQLPG